MTVETVVKPVARSTHAKGTIATKSTFQQWIVEIKSTQHESNCGINPLVDAAAIIFTSATELKQTIKPVAAKALQQRLVKEVSDYQKEIQNSQYAPDMVLASRYCLCATLDEIIRNTAWGAHQYWDSHNLLTKLHQDSSHGKRFFPILERIQKTPEQYADLLELMYLCMSMGFKGQYRNTLYGASQLNQIMDQLYRQIRKQRGEFSKELSPSLPQIATPPAKQKESFLHNSLITIGITFFIIAIIASSFSYLFKLTSQQIFNNIVYISGASLDNDNAGK